MATLWQRLFTASDGEAWTSDSSGGWTRIGPAFDALIYGNRGQAGVTATERIYRCTSYVAPLNHKAELDAEWLNAAGAGRRVGVGMRVSADGDDGYFFELDSNVGTTRVRIRRRNGGSEADVTGAGWTAIDGSPFFVSATELNAGVTLKPRIETKDDGSVQLTFVVNDGSADHEVLDVNDAGGSQLTSGGTLAVRLGPNWATSDLTIDNLKALDLEDEATATPTELGTGVALGIDGSWYSWEELRDAGIQVRTLRQTYGTDDVGGFGDSLLFEDQSGLLYPGAVVTMTIDGTVAAFGIIRQSGTSITEQEGHSFTLKGPKSLAQDVLLEHPDTGATTIAYNQDPESDLFEPARSGLTVGEIIEDLLGLLAEGDGGLRSQLCYPATGDGWTPGELALLDVEIPDLQLSGSIVSAVESLLSFTSYVLFIEPDSLEWHFHLRNGGTSTAVSLDDDHVTAELDVDPDRNFTAVKITGSKPEATPTTLSTKDGTLSQGWDSALEASHDAERSFKDTDTGLVQSTGVDGSGYLTVTVDPIGPPAYSMESGEWTLGKLAFTDGAEAGNSYPVSGNSGSDFVLGVSAWESGGPAPGDTFVVSGDLDGGGRSNGYKAVGRRWVPTDPNLEIAKGTCELLAEIEQGQTKVTTKIKLEDKLGDSTAQGVNTDLPAIGLINFTTPTDAPDGCNPGDAGAVADVTLPDLPVFDKTDPAVPTLRVPSSGFRGSSFTTDPAKWNGGGLPAKGDPRVQRVYPLSIPEYKGTAAQDAAFTKLADSILEIVGPLAREATITISGLDTTWLGLDRVVTFTSGERTLDASLYSDLMVLAVEYDFFAETTTLYCGTQAAGPYDVNGMRRAFVAQQNETKALDLQERLRELLECFNRNTHGADTVGAPDPTYISECQVQVSTSSGTTTLGQINNEECATPDPVDGDPSTGEPSDGDPCQMACNAFPCATVTNEANFLQNAGDAEAGTVKLLEAAGWISYLKRHVSCLWLTLGGIASSHDQELHKTFLNLGIVRVQTTGLKDCVNSNFTEVCDRIAEIKTWIECWEAYFIGTFLPAIGVCFTNKVDGPGAACGIPLPECVVPDECTLTQCTWDFTETVCDPTACAQPVPEIGGYTGCTP